ncbi:hypothetical protein [uncultured Sulfitobacter sp.]|uniref:hypothetical protein n=1 Tax=uncultured Sulfitobacter sp. TaxID=191468 RepID=UPI00260F48C7|nr:hypothetical protein [uncultured Sulfitobacter sp.]
MRCHITLAAVLPLMLWIGQVESLYADEVEGLISGVDVQSMVDSRLPTGALFVLGHVVDILAETPDLGPSQSQINGPRQPPPMERHQVYHK